MLAEVENSALSILEAETLQCPQVPCPVIHRFGPGVYIREVSIPANTFAIGHRQNFEHLNVLLQGRVSVAQDDGSVVELKAPMIFVGKPGRKVGYIHEDMVWLNIYNTNETDVEKLEALFITKSSEWLEGCNQQLLSIKSTVDNADFDKVLVEFGVSKELADEQARNDNDLIELPFGGYKIKVSTSQIEGKGLFATADIAEGDVIASARIDGKRTIAGRYTNHSANPNAKMMRGEMDDICLVAIKPISGCKGGFDGEEITIDYRQALQLTLQIGNGEKL